MIDILIIIIILISMIVLTLIKTMEEVRIILNLIIVTSLFFYIGFNIENSYISKTFLILAIIILILIPITLILKYIEKITN